MGADPNTPCLVDAGNPFGEWHRAAPFVVIISCVMCVSSREMSTSDTRGSIAKEITDDWRRIKSVALSDQLSYKDSMNSLRNSLSSVELLQVQTVPSPTTRCRDAAYDQ